MYLTIGTSYWIALPLALAAAGFLVRIFIIQHDCGHGSFFKSQRANHVLGLLCSLFTLTPFAAWRRPYCGTRHRYDTRLLSSEADPEDSIFVDPAES